MSNHNSEQTALEPFWETRSVALTFKLGEIRLGRISMAFQVFAPHFTALDTDLSKHRPRAIDLGLRGALIRSHPISAELPSIADDGGYLRYVPRQYNRYFVDMTGTFDAYLKRFSSKTRSTLTRRVRKFAEYSAGTVDFRTYATPDQLVEFHRLARPLSEKTYQARLLESGLPHDQAFIEQSIHNAEADQVRAYLLFHDRTPVAYLYCPIQHEVLEYQYLGYDPAYSKLSVGTVLQQLALERMFAEQRYRLFDFTEGEGEHKRQFSTGSTRCADLYYFRRTRSNEFVVRSHEAFGRLGSQFGKLAERTQLKSGLKRLIRTWA